MRGSDGREWYLVAFDEDKTGRPMVVVGSDLVHEIAAVLRWIQRIKDGGEDVEWKPSDAETVHIEIEVER